MRDQYVVWTLTLKSVAALSWTLIKYYVVRHHCVRPWYYLTPFGLIDRK